MENKVLKPKIRFKGFTDTWEQRKVKDICSISTGKSNTQDKIDDGKYPFYVRSEIVEHSNRYLYDEEAVLTVGDGVGTGKVFHYVNGKYDLHQRVYRCYGFSENISAKYFYYYFSKNFYDRVMQMTAKTSVDSVRYEMIADMDFLYPSLEEQIKIVSELTNLDNLITLHQSKYDKLVNVKKALLEKMFPKDGKNVPEIRFKGFTDTWEQHKFSRLANVRRGLTYSPIDISKNGVRVLRSSNIQEDKFIYSEDDVFVNKNAINIDYVKNNDILITSANGSTRLVGKHALISGLPSSSAVHGGFMLLATANENPEFLNASMSSSWYSKFIELFVSGGNGAIGNLSKSDLDEQEILVPSSEEQKKLGQLFKMIDNLITLHQHKLEKLKNMKKSLLNKMFI